MTREHPDDRDAERGADDDAVWRSIVDNYGDRVLDEDDLAAPESSQAAAPAEPEDDDPTRLRRLFRPVGGEEPAVPDELEPDPYDRFIPPDPPPLPRPTPDRLLAWFGVFGAPAILLVTVITGFGLPQLIAAGLAVWFLGGFGYLVFTMPDEPREPWDDGAQI